MGTQRWAALALGLALVAGCEKTLETKNIQTKIESEVKSRSWPMKSVSCPPKVKAKKGDKFTCTVELEDGQTVTMGVVQQDEVGNCNIDSASTVIPLAGLLDDFKKQLNVDTIDCPKKAVIFPPGTETKLKCKVTRATATGELTLSVDDKGKAKGDLVMAGAGESAPTASAASAKPDASADDDKDE